ncbi:hypothetical protein [Corynebacterium sp. A21]
MLTNLLFSLLLNNGPEVTVNEPALTFVTSQEITLSSASGLS